MDTKSYARVTEILRGAGLTDFSKIPQANRDWYMERGKQLHLATEYVERGIADQYTFDPILEPYLKAYQRFIDETGFKAFPDGIEKKVVNEVYRYRGTLDRYGMMCGRKTLIDLKTSQVYPETGIQCALYALALPDSFFEIDRYGVALRNDGTYRLVAFKDRTDKDVALAAVALFYWKKNNNKLEA